MSVLKLVVNIVQAVRLEAAAKLVVNIVSVLKLVVNIVSVLPPPIGATAAHR